MQKSKLQSMGRWGETEGAPGENERGVGPAPAGLCVAVVDSWSCAGVLPSVAGDGPCACGLCGCQGEGEPQRRPLRPYQRRRGATRREAGGRRRRDWSATNPDSVSCGRFVPPRRARLLFSSPSRASFPRAIPSLFPPARRALPCSRAACFPPPSSVF